MTLQQLKYAVTVAECGTISAAAEKLFISQPSLTTAIRELESEMGVTIFSRTNRGVIVSREGEEFLGYARQILSQAQLLQERFSGQEQGEKRFAVSSQHFNFTVLAFSRLVQNFRGPRYSFHFRETTTYEVLEDVSQLRSEVGILALNEDNERFLRRMFGKLGLEFTELKRVQAELFVSAEHPLAGRRFVTVEDVSPYPCITFEQGEHNGQFFFEGLSAVAAQSHKTICVRERATEYQLLRALNGFSPDVGVSAMYREEFVSLPLEPKQFHTIGYILRRDVTPSPMTLEYIQALREAASI
ncbi:MAG: LysR family transcriptional regulator [Oscillospiraceae bacterium]|nr:LysR family transcriptional regulator [Oscillospiraceae bacterium]